MKSIAWRYTIVEELLEVFDYQRKLVNYDETLIHYKNILKQLEDEEYE